MRAINKLASFILLIIFCNLHSQENSHFSKLVNVNKNDFIFTNILSSHQPMPSNKNASKPRLPNYNKKITGLEYFDYYNLDSVVYLQSTGAKYKTTFENNDARTIFKETRFEFKNDKWVPLSRKTYNYDTEYVSVEINEKYENDKWIYTTKYEEVYDEKLQEVTFRADYKWENGWVVTYYLKNSYNSEGMNYLSEGFSRESNLLSRHEYFYDEQGRQTESIYYETKNGIESLIAKWTYEYDLEYYSSLYQYYLWENNTWLWQYSSYDKIDDNGYLIETKYETSSSSDTVETYLEKYNYNNNVLVFYQSFKLIDNDWVLIRDFNKSIDENNNTEVSISNYYENGIVKKAEKSTRIYNTNHQILLALDERMENSTWRTVSKATYTYNEFGNLTSYNSEYQYHENDDKVGYKTIVDYNSKQNIIMTVNNEFLNDILVGSSKTINGYDNKDRLIFSKNLHLYKDKYVANDTINYNFPVNAGNELKYSEAYAYYRNGIEIVRSDQDFKAIFELSQNYPNPFNPNTTIVFRNNKQAKVKIDLFNSLGQKIKTLTNKEYAVGTHYLQINSRDLASGNYFYRLEADNYVKTKKLTVLK